MFTYLKHFFHLIFITQKQYTSVFARYILYFCHKRINYGGLVRITARSCTVTAAIFPVKHIRLIRIKYSETASHIMNSSYLVDYKYFSYCSGQNCFGLAFRLAQMSTNKISWIFHHHYGELLLVYVVSYQKSIVNLHSPLLSIPSSPSIWPYNFATVVLPVPGEPRNARFKEILKGFFSRSSLW